MELEQTCLEMHLVQLVEHILKLLLLRSAILGRRRGLLLDAGVVGHRLTLSTTCRVKQGNLEVRHGMPEDIYVIAVCLYQIASARDQIWNILMRCDGSLSCVIERDQQEPKSGQVPVGGPKSRVETNSDWPLSPKAGGGVGREASSQNVADAIGTTW